MGGNVGGSMLVARGFWSAVRLAGWIEPKLADCGFGWCGCGLYGWRRWCDPGVPTRAVVISFWCFFAAFFGKLLFVLDGGHLECFVLNYANNILCTTIAVKGANRRCGWERGDLVGMELMLIAHDEDMNGNMYWLANRAVAWLFESRCVISNVELTN